MNSIIIYAFGFTAQLLFSSRLIVQWILSEKQKRIVTPSLFWKLSLLASILLFIYGFYRNDLAIMLGQVLTYYIYIRNLQLQKEWRKAPFLLRWLVILGPLVLLLTGYLQGNLSWSKFTDKENIATWLLILGVVSQVLFTFRFVYQWLHSEKIKVSELSIGFWRLSIAGASLVLVYATFRQDPVLWLGHGSGMIIYIRNTIIWKKQQNAVEQ